MSSSHGQGSGSRQHRRGERARNGRDGGEKYPPDREYDSYRPRYDSYRPQYGAPEMNTRRHVPGRDDERSWIQQRHEHGNGQGNAGQPRNNTGGTNQGSIGGRGVTQMGGYGGRHRGHGHGRGRRGSSGRGRDDRAGLVGSDYERGRGDQRHHNRGRGRGQGRGRRIYYGAQRGDSRSAHHGLAEGSTEGPVNHNLTVQQSRISFNSDQGITTQSHDENKDDKNSDHSLPPQTPERGRSAYRRRESQTLQSPSASWRTRSADRRMQDRDRSPTTYPMPSPLDIQEGYFSPPPFAPCSPIYPGDDEYVQNGDIGSEIILSSPRPLTQADYKASELRRREHAEENRRYWAAKAAADKQEGIHKEDHDEAEEKKEEEEDRSYGYIEEDRCGPHNR
ncbi:hypothetical protein DE146DRAFT_773244 [Phaeosphaeria sp. MPI-PUGE-AT-0046c]|nr:hypothetical protein DE146DRAFT_773244 [Phaeosphaeria sp. MPI-PUGE-AT-0046c]